MIDVTQDIHSLTTFKRNSSGLMKRMKKTGRPLVLTVNGKAEAVLLDAAASFARERGCAVLRGPFNMTAAQEMGIVVEGFGSLTADAGFNDREVPLVVDLDHSTRSRERAKRGRAGSSRSTSS
jgi:prevent-host-death family protein